MVSNDFKKNGIDKFSIFLIMCSGVPLKTVERCYTDYNKFKNIGASLIITGLFAGVAGGYALSMVFPKNLLLCVFFGLIWGISIFNIDMLLVGTYYKSTNFSISNFFSFSIRIILAAAIGFTISVPLEIKLFETEIINYIQDKFVKQNKEEWDLKKSADLKYYDGLIEQNGKTIKELTSNDQYKGVSIKNEDTLNYSFLLKRLSNDDKLRSTLSQEKLNEIASNTKIRDDILKLTYNTNLEPVDINNYGFISRYNYLEQIKEHEEGKNYLLASWLIRFIIVLFEIIPLIIRVLLNRSHFDLLMENELLTRERENGIYYQNKPRHFNHNNQSDI